MKAPINFLFWYHMIIEMILRSLYLTSFVHEMGNKLKLVRDFTPFHRNSFKNLRHSDTALIVNCVEGEKKYFWPITAKLSGMHSKKFPTMKN